VQSGRTPLDVAVHDAMRAVLRAGTPPPAPAAAAAAAPRPPASPFAVRPLVSAAALPHTRLARLCAWLWALLLRLLLALPRGVAAAWRRTRRTAPAAAPPRSLPLPVPTWASAPAAPASSAPPPPALTATKSGTTCCVCLEARPSSVLLPCKHAALCSGAECARALGTPRRCPICRKPVREVLTGVFF
jgi:hypothetical protein